VCACSTSQPKKIFTPAKISVKSKRILVNLVLIYPCLHSDADSWATGTKSPRFTIKIRAGFKGGQTGKVAHGLHKNSKKLLPKET